MRTNLGTAFAIVFVTSCTSSNGNSSNSAGVGCSGGGGGGDWNWGSSGGGGSGSGGGGGSTGDCPVDEMCSPLTPAGLEFAGAQAVFPGLPNGLVSSVNHHIATGGTDDITLNDITTAAEFDLPYSALSSATDVLTVEETAGPIVSLRAFGGTAYLRVVDPVNGELYDRYSYASSGLATMQPVPTLEWITVADWLAGTAPTFVFATGDQTIGVALLNAATPHNRLIDTSVRLELAGATQTAWDQLRIPAATVGHKTVTVHAGDTAQNLDIEIVDHADSIATLSTADGSACFGAYAHGVFIAGLTWTFTIDNAQVAASDVFPGPNCVSNPAGPGPFTVTASAGGKSLTLTTPTGPAAHLDVPTLARVRGERAR